MHAVQCNTGQCRFHCPPPTPPPLNYLDSFSIGATIRTRREIQCLPYAGFFLDSIKGRFYFKTTIKFTVLYYTAMTCTALHCTKLN